MTPSRPPRRARPPRLPAAAFALSIALAACASPPASPSTAPSPRPPAGSTTWEQLEWYARSCEETQDPVEKARLYHRMGALYLDAGRPERARDAFRRSQYADSDGPLSGANWKGIGEAYLREGSAAPAVLSLRDAVEALGSETERDEALFLLARALEASGQPEEARAARARIADPSRPSLAVLEGELRLPDPAPSAPPLAARPALATTILPRARWGAAPTLRTADPMGTPRNLTIHHSAMEAQVSEFRDAASEIRRIQRAHQRNEGWADIGYHFLIDGSGRLWEGRPLYLQGAHAGSDSANRANVGICLLGDFAQDPPSAAQLETLEALIAALRSKFSIPAGNLYTHREIRRRFGLGHTECPGTYLQALVERMRRSGPRAARVPGAPTLPTTG